MVQRFKPGDANKDQRPKAGKKIEFSSQNPDGRNGRNESKKIMKNPASYKLSDIGRDIKGSELMKVAKKPKTIDLSDIDGLISLPHMEPGKPPPAEVANSLPNYMKPTRSSGAKKDGKQASVVNCVKGNTCDKTQARKSLKNPKPDASGRCLVKLPSLKLARNLTKSSSFKQTGCAKKKSLSYGSVNSDKHVQKATCSSLLKDSKFPAHVMIEAGGSEASGASSMEVCSYKYCSLNGHRHGVAQPLKSFISDRRRSLKTQKSSKLKDDASGQVLLLEVKEDEDFFVEIHETVELENNSILATGTDTESVEELYETIWEAYEKEIQEFEYIEAQMEEEVFSKLENEEEFDCISENSFKGSVTVSDDVEEILIEDELEGCCEEDACKTHRQNSEEIDETFSDMEDLVDKEMIFAEDETTLVCTEENENAEDDLIEDKCEMERESVKTDQNAFVCTAANGESEIGLSGIKITKGKRAGDEDSDSEKDFNPQEPNYLPLEPKPKAEQVDLKHQDMDERRNSEEWMVDYALRKTLTKLAPVKRKKVELLVEAFESVAPVTKRDHHSKRDSSPFDDIRTIQPSRLLEGK